MDSCFGLIRPRQHGIANKMAQGSHTERCKVKQEWYNCGKVIVVYDDSIAVGGSRSPLPGVSNSYTLSMMQRLRIFFPRILLLLTNHKRININRCLINLGRSDKIGVGMRGIIILDFEQQF